MQELYKNSTIRNIYNEYFYQNNIDKLSTVFEIMIKEKQIKSHDPLLLAHEFFSPLFFYQKQINLLKIDGKQTSSMVTLFEKHVSMFWENVKFIKIEKEENNMEIIKEQKDLFAQKSKHWDVNSRRVQSANAIAQKIIENIELKKEMHIMDFGSGTGLLSYCISDKIGKVTALDNSPSMLDVFKEKSVAFSCPTEIIEIDLTTNTLPNETKYDGIISSMTMHHIEDIKALFETFYSLLSDDGFIALADLDQEKGDFHSDNEGVFHFGFQREVIEKIALDVGFKEIQFSTANTIEKPHATYTIFLLIAQK